MLLLVLIIDRPSAQTRPIISELEKNDSVTFLFLEGLIEQPMSAEIEGLYDGPYYGYFRCDYSPTKSGPTSMVEATCDGTLQKSVAEAYALLYDTLEEEGPFDVVIGFSHGATLAYAFLRQHAEAHPLEPPYALFRCAVFISGSPPPRAKLNNDESDGALLRIPTLHIAGKADALLPESLDLHKLCDPNTSKLVCHNGGHWIPRDRDVTIIFAKAIEALVNRSIVI